VSDRDTVADVKARLLDAEDEHSEGVMAAILDHLLRLHVHEVAEKAREVMGPRQLPSGAEPENITRYVAGWHDATDFIDPEVH
jgi:hypothetical protein